MQMVVCALRYRIQERVQPGMRRAQSQQLGHDPGVHEHLLQRAVARHHAVAFGGHQPARALAAPPCTPPPARGPGPAQPAAHGCENAGTAAPRAAGHWLVPNRPTLAKPRAAGKLAMAWGWVRCAGSRGAACSLAARSLQGLGLGRFRSPSYRKSSPGSLAVCNAGAGLPQGVQAAGRTCS